MSCISNASCFARTRMADLINLLYTTASEYTNPHAGKNSGLNPVPGVRLRAKDANVEYHPDKQAFVGNAQVDASEPPIPQNLFASSTLVESTAKSGHEEGSVSQANMSSSRNSNTVSRPTINENNINPMMYGLEFPNEFGYGMDILDRWEELGECISLFATILC